MASGWAIQGGRTIEIRARDMLPTSARMIVSVQHAAAEVATQAGSMRKAQGWLSTRFGNSSQKALPWSGADSTPTRPPIRSAPLRTIARPMPVPG
jgi:hypothetical protein